MPGAIEKIFGPRLKILRVKLGYSQDSLAAELGIRGGRIADIEQSESEGMYLDNFRRLSELARMSVDELRNAIGADHHHPLTESEKKLLAARVRKSPKGDKRA